MSMRGEAVQRQDVASAVKERIALTSCNGRRAVQLSCNDAYH
jgi:hypothetical protein